MGNPLALFDRIFRGAAFSFQKNNKTDHLRDKELLTTTKPQKPVKLTIDNSQLSSNWDIGMNMRHANHFNTCRLWLRMFVKDITRYTLNTLKITARSKELQVKPLEVQFNLRDTFGYMPLPKESWSSYIKFSKSGKSGTKRSSTNLPTRDNLWSTTGHVLFFKRRFRKSNS